jgi:hypothetical protein
VTAQIHATIARDFRKQEPVAEFFQGIAFIERNRKILAGLKLEVAQG